MHSRKCMPVKYHIQVSINTGLPTRTLCHVYTEQHHPQTKLCHGFHQPVHSLLILTHAKFGVYFKIHCVLLCYWLETIPIRVVLSLARHDDVIQRKSIQYVNFKVYFKKFYVLLWDRTNYIQIRAEFKSAILAVI